VDRQGRLCLRRWVERHLQRDRVRRKRRFSQPVRVGHLVQATARLVNTGRSSMQVLSPWNQVQSRTGSCPRQPNA
jgi:acyl-CoA hydrolase